MTRVRGELRTWPTGDATRPPRPGFGPLGPCDPVFEGGPNLTDPVALEPVLDGAHIVGDPNSFPHGLWCNVFRSVADQPQPRAPLTDAGVVMAAGPVPGFDHVENVAIDVPGDGPSFVTVDEPRGALELLGTIEGYVAHSDDDGRTWTKVPGSPWWGSWTPRWSARCSWRRP